jgi:hypothetical protein
MKKAFIVAFAALFTLAIASVQAQELFYLTKKGAVAEYEGKDSSGVVDSYTLTTVTDVDIVDGRNYTLSYTNETFNNKHKRTQKPTPEPVVVRNGVRQAPSKVEGIKMSGTLPFYPTDLSVGYKSSFKITMKLLMGLAKANVEGKYEVTERETITTRAGSFDCFKIETIMTVVIKDDEIEHRQDIMKTISWIAAGVGEVRSEMRDPEGKLMMTEELISLK